MNSYENHRQVDGGIRWVWALRRVGVLSAILAVVTTTAVPRASAQDVVTTVQTDFRQAANDDSGTCGISPGHACNLGDAHWINSILQQSNARYLEGMSVPQRTIFRNVPDTSPGNLHMLTLSHQATKGGIHAYDFLTSWSQAVDAADGIAPTVTEPGDDLLFHLTADKCGENIGPPDPEMQDFCTMGKDYCVTVVIADAVDNGCDGNPDPMDWLNGSASNIAGHSIDARIATYEGVFGNRTLEICGDMPITAACVTSKGHTNGADMYAEYELHWTSASTEIQILMAGHLAISGNATCDTKFGAGCTGYGPGNGAASISGGPYHFKLDKLDGASLGSQDNQIKGADIIFCTPTQCDDNKSCTDDICDEVTDTCSHVPFNSRCDDGNSCTDDLCNAANGPSPTGCVYTPVAESTPCEADGDLCTNDHCNGAGLCVFLSDKPCPGPTGPCDGGSSCNPATGACEANPDPAFSTPCERDGSLCTNDHCDGSGNCVFLNDKPCPPNTPCETFACNPATGTCVGTPRPLSTSCEADGDLCTIDHCDGTGSCVTFDNVVCAANTQCASYACNPGTGVCDATFEVLSTTCERESPANLCTPDHCDGAGSCVPNGPPVACAGTQCAGEVCDPATGTCVVPPGGFAPLSTPCEVDGNFCTIEHCDGAGSCVPLGNVVCPANTQCASYACNPGTGACDVTFEVLSTICERDGSLCTNDHCDGAGNCVFLNNKPCPPPTQCASYACNPGTGACDVTFDPLSTSCDADIPADLCKVDHCDGLGNCVFFFNVMCSPPLGPCDGGENCNPMNGLCEPKPDPEFSTFCERGDPLGLCTNDHCDGLGNCVFLNEKTCPLPDPPCEAGANCDPANGLCVDKDDPPLSTFCETDADACTRQHCDGFGNCVLEKEICGACCDGITGVCVNDLFENQCLNVLPDDQFTWYQALLCSEIPPPGCVRHTGACCDYREKRCIDGVFPEDCPEPGRMWVKGATCASNPCESFHCGPGPHWIDNCPGEIDYLDGTQVLAAIDLDLDPCCIGDVVLTLDGNVVITRSGALDDSAFYPGTRPVDGHLDVIDTEIVSMTLTGGGATMTVGGGLSPGGKPLARSFGTIAERVDDPTLGDSFFDVFFAIDLGGGIFIYNHDAVRVEAVLVKVPPKAVNYIHAVQCVPLFTNPVGGIQVANLSEAAHCVGGGCPPGLFQGACCDPEQPGGLCTDGLLREGCCGGQKFFTRGASCAEVKCNEHEGACCDQRISDPVERCHDDVPQSLCPVANDPSQIHWFKDTLCADVDEECAEHTGACCDTSPLAGGKSPEGVCTDNVLPANCSGPQQVWTKFTACADITCLEVPGACCDLLKGVCSENVYFGDCQGDQQAWTKGASCAEVECIARTGACCDLDPFGTCTISTIKACNCQKCVWHKLKTCEQIECVHNAIPTMSQWGLAVLTLLLLIGAKVYFGRRPVEAV